MKLGFRVGDGVVADLKDVLDTLVAIDAFDGVESERARGDYAVDVGSDVEGSLWV